MKQLKKSKKFLFFLIIAFIIILFIPFYFKYKEITTLKMKPISCLSYKDLIELCSPLKPQSELYLKLEKQLTTPYIVNKTNSLKNKSFDRSYLRLAHWNIARGYRLDAIKNVFSNHFDFYYSYKKNIKPSLHDELKKELYDLSQSDIIVLNEVDIGMPRTSYKDVVSELAGSLKYNYAFATEFIELGPIVEHIMVDPKRYYGLHGNALLSKYPIQNARVIRLPECYKWFEAELQRKSPLEKARRYGAKTVFSQEIISEARRGGRGALVADIQLPNKEIITVVSTHLEDRCYPDCRFKQAQHLFEKLKYIRRPVVIAGDFNTSTTDTTPTSLKKEVVKRLRDRDFIARQVALAFIPLGIPIPGLSNIASATLSRIFQYKDPASPNIPVFFPNHERKLFKYIKEFQFADGEKFDTRGDSKRSSNGKRGLLANSNERQLKGFESTFEFEEPRVIAYFKLDWFFVKPKLGRFEPFNGQTLQLVNETYTNRISDHAPITVDLTL